MIRLWEKCVIPHLTPLDRDLYSTVERLQVCIHRWGPWGLSEEVLNAAASVHTFWCGYMHEVLAGIPVRHRSARRRKVRSYL
jgi:hypothetical protein